MCGFEVASAEGAPRGYAHAFGGAHAEDLAFEVALRGAPAALVYDEGSEVVGAGVLVGFADDPGGGVADAEVEDFTLLD